MPEIVYQPLSALRPFPRNARTHSKKQVQQIARSIERFGFTNPVLVSDDGEIIAGHGRVRAAALLGMATVPTIALSHLSEAERRAYVLADNKLALNAGWDSEILAIELQGLIDLDFDVTLTGFSLAEIDFTIDAANDAKPNGRGSADDRVPQLPEHPVTRRGELWQLGRHLLLCSDARDPDAYVRLLGNYKRKKADGQRAIDQARQAGKPEPFLLPHPDDIIIDDEMMTFRVDGPICATTLALEMWQVQLRDHLALRYVYQMRFPSLLLPVDPNGHKTYAEGAKVMNEGLWPRQRWGQHGFWKVTEAHKAKGFRFIERDMTESLAALGKTWRGDPELEPLRQAKSYRQMVEGLLKFRTLGQERRLWQSYHDRIRWAFEAIYGPKYVASMPKRASLKPYAVREAEDQKLYATAPPELLEKARERVRQIVDAIK